MEKLRNTLQKSLIFTNKKSFFVIFIHNFCDFEDNILSFTSCIFL